MRASIDANTRVSVLASRENGLSERNAMGILLVFELFPKFTRQALAEQRCGSSRENWEASDIFGFLEVGAAFGLLTGGSSSSLDASAKLFLLGNHSFDTVVHILNKLNFRETESSLVGDVINMISRFGVLTVNSANLNFETVSNCLEFFLSCTKFRQSNVDRGS